MNKQRNFRTLRDYIKLFDTDQTISSLPVLRASPMVKVSAPEEVKKSTFVHDKPDPSPALTHQKCITKNKGEDSLCGIEIAINHQPTTKEKSSTMDITSKSKKGTTGYGSFFKMNKHNMLEQVLLRRERIKRSSLSDNENWYIENRNTSYTPKRCLGMAVAVRQKPSTHSLFYYGIILENVKQRRGFIYLKLKENVCLEKFTENRSYVWSEIKHLFDVSTFDGIKNISKKEVYFLNQITGKALFGASVNYSSVINNVDGCYEFATKGPDNVLTMKLHQNTIKKMIRKVSIIDTSSPSDIAESKISTLPTVFRKHSLSKYRKLLKHHKKNEPYFMKPPKRMIQKLHTTIYTVDQGSKLRTEVCPSHSSQRLIAVPLFKQSGCFGNISHKDLVTHFFPTNGMLCPDKHDELVLRYAVSLSNYVEVPQQYYENGFKIRVCSEEMIQYVKSHIKHQTLSSNPEILVAEETAGCVGVPKWPQTKHSSKVRHYMAPVVSTYLLGKEPNPQQVTLGDVSDMIHAFGPQGYGSRKITHVEGFNLYGGFRSSSNAAAANPVEGKSSTSKNDFYRSRFILEEAAVLTKLINNLVFQGTLVPITCEYLVVNFIQPEHESGVSSLNGKNTFCRTKIITFGNGRTIGFSNSSHTDRCDALVDVDNHFVEYLIHCKEKYSNNDNVLDAVEYLLNWIKFQGIAVPTTCVYQFIGSENLKSDDEVHSYFLHDGIGIAVLLVNYLCHCFYGHSFSHRTALTLITRNINGKRKVFYTIKDLHIFAWGSSGTSSEDGGRSRARNNAIRRVRRRMEATEFGLI